MLIHVYWLKLCFAQVRCQQDNCVSGFAVCPRFGIDWLSLQCLVTSALTKNFPGKIGQYLGQDALTPCIARSSAVVVIDNFQDQQVQTHYLGSVSLWHIDQISKLAQHWFSFWLVTCPASSIHRNLCWLIVNFNLQEQISVKFTSKQIYFHNTRKCKICRKSSAKWQPFCLSLLLLKKVCDKCELDIQGQGMFLFSYVSISPDIIC